MSLLPVDLSEIIHEELLKNRRPDDGLLHASSHLAAPMRHVQLEMAGAPQLPRPVVDEIVLMTGTMWHHWIEETLKKLGLPFMAEVNVTPWMPKGWGGTADITMWVPEHTGFSLIDVKTSKGESIRWRAERGASEEHVWQTSVYWHALKKMGLPMLKEIGVFYLPKNDTRKKDEFVEPLLVEFEPLPLRKLAATMKQRREMVEAYKASLPKKPKALKSWVTDALEPPSERQQRVYFDRRSGVHVLKLVPDWHASFCPFPLELCDCSTQGTTTLGLFDERGEYQPRPGFEDIAPEVFPEE